jgi:hypothetical protein
VSVAGSTTIGGSDANSPHRAEHGIVAQRH